MSPRERYLRRRDPHHLESIADISTSTTIALFHTGVTRAEWDADGRLGASRPIVATGHCRWYVLAAGSLT